MNQHKQESNKKRCVGIFTERLSRTQYCHIQNPVKHLRRSLLQTANHQKKRNGKDSIKMITRHFKLNILPVQNQSGRHIRITIYLNKKLFLSYEELKTCKIETSENSRQ